MDFRHTTASSEDVPVTSLDLRQLSALMRRELSQHRALHVKFGTDWGDEQPDKLIFAYDEVHWRNLCCSLAKHATHDTSIELNIIKGDARTRSDLLLPLAIIKRVFSVIYHVDIRHPFYKLLSRCMSAELENVKVGQETCLAFLEEGQYLENARAMVDAAAVLYEQGRNLSRHFQRFVSLRSQPSRAREYNTLLRMELDLLLAAISAHLDVAKSFLESDKAAAQRRLDHCRGLANDLFEVFSMTDAQRVSCHATKARVYEYYAMLWKKSGVVARRDWMRVAAEDYYWAALLRSDADPFQDADLQRVNAQRPADERMTAENCVRPQTVPMDGGGTWTGDPRLLRHWHISTLMPGPLPNRFITMPPQQLETLAAKLDSNRDMGATGFLRLLALK